MLEESGLMAFREVGGKMVRLTGNDTEKILIARKIARAEKARDLVYEEAMNAYWNGPSWALLKLEAKVEEMNRELEMLERMRA
jgi:hypothetical protein